MVLWSGPVGAKPEKTGFVEPCASTPDAPPAVVDVAEGTAGTIARNLDRAAAYMAEGQDPSNACRSAMVLIRVLTPSDPPLAERVKKLCSDCGRGRKATAPSPAASEAIAELLSQARALLMRSEDPASPCASANARLRGLKAPDRFLSNEVEEVCVVRASTFRAEQLLEKIKAEKAAQQRPTKALCDQAWAHANKGGGSEWSEAFSLDLAQTCIGAR